MMGYTSTDPEWWTPEARCDHYLSHRYCRGTRRTTSHPRGTMFDRRSGLANVHSGYLTQGRLLALVAHAFE
jgi:hypothetical protein